MTAGGTSTVMTLYYPHGGLTPPDGTTTTVTCPLSRPMPAEGQQLSPSQLQRLVSLPLVQLVVAQPLYSHVTDSDGGLTTLTST